MSEKTLEQRVAALEQEMAGLKATLANGVRQKDWRRTIGNVAGGQGDVTLTHRLWRHTEKIPQRIGSAVIVNRHVYILNEDGLAQCFDLDTGKEVRQKERLSSERSWGSLVAGAGRLYVTNHAGETLVLKADPSFEVLAKNKIGERVLSSCAVCDGEIFIRSYQHLWRIGE